MRMSAAALTRRPFRAAGAPDRARLRDCACAASPEPRAPTRSPIPTAVFDGLDKITGRIISFEVALNETVQFGTLQITPRICYSRPPTEAPQTDVFAEVDEIDEQKAVKRIFSGWMFADSPGLHGVEHPIYDVWLTACKGGTTVIHEAPRGRRLGARDGCAAGRRDRRQRAAVAPGPDARAPAEEEEAEASDGGRRPLRAAARRQQRAARSRRRDKLGQRARAVAVGAICARTNDSREASPSAGAAASTSRGSPIRPRRSRGRPAPRYSPCPDRRGRRSRARSPSPRARASRAGARWRFERIGQEGHRGLRMGAHLPRAAAKVEQTPLAARSSMG